MNTIYVYTAGQRHLLSISDHGLNAEEFGNWIMQLPTTPNVLNQLLRDNVEVFDRMPAEKRPNFMHIRLRSAHDARSAHHVMLADLALHLDDTNKRLHAALGADKTEIIVHTHELAMTSAQLIDRNRALEAQNEALQKRIDNQADTITDYMQQMKTLQADLATQKQYNQNQRDTIRSMRETYETNRANLERKYAGEISKLQAHINTQHEMILAQEQRISDLETIVTDAGREQTAAQKTIRDLQAQVLVATSGTGVTQVPDVVWDTSVQVQRVERAPATILGTRIFAEMLFGGTDVSKYKVDMYHQPDKANAGVVLGETLLPVMMVQLLEDGAQVSFGYHDDAVAVTYDTGSLEVGGVRHFDLNDSGFKFRFKLTVA